MKILDSLYHIRNLTYRYKEENILEIDDLKIRTCSITGFVGPNGSGKSTLLRLLAFIESPFSGEIIYRERPEKPFSSSARFNITLLTQEPYLLRRSVYSNIAYGLKLRRDTKAINQRIRQILSVVGFEPDLFIHRRWCELSGGEAQRIALAARLILKPDVLILDEPTASVDAFSAHRIKMASLAAKKEWGTSLIIASHDVEWLFDICDDVFQIYHGKIVGKGRWNIIEGPWQKRGNGSYESVSLDGIAFIVPPPPRSTSSAAISSCHVELKKDKPLWDADANVLSGVVTRLSVDRMTGDSIANVLVGNIYLTASMGRDRKENRSIYPGDWVHVVYSLNCVKWI